MRRRRRERKRDRGDVEEKEKERQRDRDRDIYRTISIIIIRMISQVKIIVMIWFRVVS